ncbi:MAG: ABC transporter ATP-binding protein, partial [Lachnospiraceae bacterium]|nr:ABC transporter ATP-binding protein [Lachnospiraceae bacterium]
MKAHANDMMRHGPGGGRGPAGKVGKPKNTKESIGRLFSYIKKDTWKIVIVLLLVVISSLTNLAGTYVLRPVMNSLTDGTGTVAILAKGLGVMALLYATGIIAQYAYQRIMIGVSQGALERIRNDLFKKVGRLPLKYYDTNDTGDIMSRFTNDVDTVGNMLNNTVVSIISGVISLVGTLFLMFYTNWILALVTIVMAPVMVKAAGAVAKKSRKYYKQQQAALGSLNGYVEETISGQKVVKVFNHERAAGDEFDYLNADLRNKQLKAQFFGGIMGPVMGNLGQMSYTIVSVVGGLLCVLRGFDIGGLTIFAGYSRQFSRPINELSMQVTEIFSALAGAERVFDAMDTPPELPDSDEALAPESLRGEIILNNVTFGYVPEKTILKNVSFYAKPGQKIALVGSTGAGKTTITNLITRFYDIDEGSISIDGIDIRHLKRDYLRQNIAMVLQDTHLFSGTVRENIRYGRLDATDEEVV